MSKMIIVEDHEDCREVLRFEDVEEDCLFINYSGCLCQKVSASCYNIIASKDGDLMALTSRVASHRTVIKKILNVTKIEF